MLYGMIKIVTRASNANRSQGARRVAVTEKRNAAAPMR